MRKLFFKLRNYFLNKLGAKCWGFGIDYDRFTFLALTKASH
jgi:hypothetical protein